MLAAHGEDSSGNRPYSVTAIVLVGFMGAGKSTVGRALGARLGWPFEDLDARIERNEGRTVVEIFRDAGEQGFRDAELIALRAAMEELKSGVPRILALGGGAFVQKRNLALILAAGVTTVFLDAPVNVLWQRCRDQAEEQNALRPLLASREKFQELHDSRRTGYLKAMLCVQTEERNVERITNEIIAALKLEQN